MTIEEKATTNRVADLIHEFHPDVEFSKRA